MCGQSFAALSFLLCCQGDGAGAWEGSRLLQGKTSSPLQPCLPNTLSKGASKRVGSSDAAWP